MYNKLLCKYQVFCIFQKTVDKLQHTVINNQVPTSHFAGVAGVMEAAAARHGLHSVQVAGAKGAAHPGLHSVQVAGAKEAAHHSLQAAESVLDQGTGQDCN